MVVAKLRGVQLTPRKEGKRDRADVEVFAGLGRFDAQLRSPTNPGSAEHWTDLAVRRARDAAAAP